MSIEQGKVEKIEQITGAELLERLIRLSVRLKRNIDRAGAQANVNLQALNGLPQLREELQALNVVIASFMLDEVKSKGK